MKSWPTAIERWAEWKSIYTNVTRPQHAQEARDYYQLHFDEMNSGAVLSWPQRESLYTLMKLQVDIGHAAFESEKQGRPINPELCEWPESYFGDSLWFDAWPKEMLAKVLTLDPSKGSTSRVGDYSAFVMAAIDSAGRLYIDADLRRRPVEEMVRDGVAHYRRFSPDAFGCETNAWQELLGPDFEAEFARQGLLAAQPWGINNHEPKLVRIRRLGPWLSGGRLRFLRNSPGASLLVQQLQDFPLGDHDDGPDALEMALRLATSLLEDRPTRETLRMTSE